MTDLTVRAEQAVLGALIAGGTAKGELGGLQGGHFADGRHQAIFAALTGAGPQPGGMLGRLRMWLTGLPFWPRVRDFRQYIAELPAICPDPGHLSSYAQMVTEASQQRRTAHARVVPDAPDPGRIAGAAAYLAREAERAAVGRRWPALGPGVATDMALTRDTAIATRMIRRNEAPPAATEATPPQEQAMSSEQLEEQVLADLMRRSAQAKDIIGWLPVEVFTSEKRREIYRDIRHRLRDGEPVDPLIIAWDLDQARQLDVSGGNRDGEALDPAYVLRIAAIDAAPGTARLIGRVLLADHVCTRRFGADWPHSLQLTRAAPVAAPDAGTAFGPQPVPGSASILPQPSAPPGPRPDPAAMEPPPLVPEPAAPVQRM